MTSTALLISASVRVAVPLAPLPPALRCDLTTKQDIREIEMVPTNTWGGQGELRGAPPLLHYPPLPPLLYPSDGSAAPPPPTHGWRSTIGPGPRV